MKRVIVLGILIGLIFAGCSLETKILTQFYDTDFSKITKIVIVDGNTGESVTRTDNEKIKLFIDDIRDIKFIPQEDQSERDGFSYSITFYHDKEEAIQFGVNYIDGNYYDTKPNIKPIVDEFYNNLK